MASPRRSAAASTEALEIEFGSLYPALKRLEIKGWIASKWEMSEQNRRAKFYRLTPAGRKRLQQEHAEWREFAAAVGRVMGRRRRNSHEPAGEDSRYLLAVAARRAEERDMQEELDALREMAGAG